MPGEGQAHISDFRNPQYHNDRKTVLGRLVETRQVALSRHSRLEQDSGLERMRKRTMSTTDNCVTIVPYFKVRADALGSFKKLCESFVERTQKEGMFVLRLLFRWG
jgi:hypothetical protein